MDLRMKKLLIIAVLALLAVVSFLFVADWAMAEKTHATTLAGIDDKAEKVLQLSAGAALASAAISAIPDDTATPVAEELADFTTYFLLVLCVLYAEKYLVTLLGAAAFRVLIPCALALVGVSLYWKKLELRQLAVKLAVIGLALFLVIPLSLRISDMVYRVYDTTIQETLTDADELEEDVSDYDWSDWTSGPIWNIAGAAGRRFRDRAVEALNRFVEALAVMIVTSCIIPVLVLLFFLWVIRQITGVDVTDRLRRRVRRRSAPAEGGGEGE